MKYDFEKLLERKGTGAIAVDSIGKMPGFAPDTPKEGFDLIPMWVADMNFITCPTITERMKERIEHPLFGYFDEGIEYYEAIIDWQKKRNNVKDLFPWNISYENGVLGGVVTALRVLCSNGDKVLINSPTYIGFTRSIEENGYRLVHSDLKKDKDGIFRLDFDDMERKVKENGISVYVFCSPHNPVGRVWTKEELKELSSFAKQNHLYIISDEIWSDIILDNNIHTPTQMGSKYLREHTIALYAPSKTFNLAGLIGSYHICYNEYLQERIRKEGSLSHYNDMNLLSRDALLGAYSPCGHEWVDELKEVLTENIHIAYDFLTKKGIEISKPEGTYMLFLDCTNYCKEHNLTIDKLLKKGWDVGVAWQDGRPFHGECHIRMNVALPKERLLEAINRLAKYVLSKNTREYPAFK